MGAGGEKKVEKTSHAVIVDDTSHDHVHIDDAC